MFFAACCSWYFALFREVSLSKHTFSHVFFSRKKSGNFPNFFRMSNTWPNLSFTNVLFVTEFFEDVIYGRLIKWAFLATFWAISRKRTAKKLPTKQHIGERQIWSSVTHTKKIRKIAGGFFREKDMRNMCVLKAKLRETMRNIRNGMLQKKISKFILCSLVARHHSMKFLCNFDHYWWRKNFLNEEHVFWNP